MRWPFCILATNLQQGEARPDGSEELMYKRIPFDKALTMVMRGELNDSLTVLAVTNYALRIGARLDPNAAAQLDPKLKPLANR